MNVANYEGLHNGNSLSLWERVREYLRRLAFIIFVLFSLSLWEGNNILDESSGSRDDESSEDYSPVRHLAKSWFPSADKKKYMLMLSAYMDETGHSRDDLQKFNGMAGLFAPADNWIEFERKWKDALNSKEFKIPYFHMNEFEARVRKRPKNLYKDWSEPKCEKLFAKLLRIIASVGAIPVGAMIAMEDWRGLTQLQQKLLHGDPYFLTYQNVIAYATSYLEFVRASPDVKVNFIFSDQVEFKYRALKLYDQIHKVGKFIKRSARAPLFEDMKEFVALQAADIVAYEMYKEHDRRRYRPRDEPRLGFNEIDKMSQRRGFPVMCRFYGTRELTDYAREAEAAARIKGYWAKKRAKEKAVG